MPVKRFTLPAPKRGDRLGLVALSSTFDRDAFMKGVEILKGNGFRVSFNESIFSEHLFFAGTRERRLQEIEEAFRDGEVKGIICARGGYGSTTLMNSLPLKAFIESPKLVAGMSDVTPLLNFLPQRIGFPTLHSPFVTSLGKYLDLKSIEWFMKCIQDPSFLPCLEACEGGSAVMEGACEGESAGGNLSLLVSTLKTPYEIETRGKVLFIEEVGERPYRIHRLLSHLKDAGKLEGVSGIAVGELPEGAGEGGGSYMDAVKDVLKGVKVPVLAGLPFGHGRRNLSFPLGVRCRMDTRKGEVRFIEPFLREGGDQGFSLDFDIPL